jgi:phosphate starvation-inducible protein PhoH and related proteins
MTENKEKRVPKSDIKFSITLTDEQKQAKENILRHPYNFVLGEAGTGKTLLSIQIALDKYFKREINKIVISRPTVSSEDNGYLPGGVKEKMEPWLVPIMDNIRKVYCKENIIEKMLEDGAIEIVSLSHFRGRTFDNAVCILDECQNLTSEQTSMCLGRLGKDSQMIFCGDYKQIDLKHFNQSGLSKLDKLKGSPYVYIIELQENHRHPALKEVLRLYYS